MKLFLSLFLIDEKGLAATSSDRLWRVNVLYGKNKLKDGNLDLVYLRWVWQCSRSRTGPSLKRYVDVRGFEMIKVW